VALVHPNVEYPVQYTFSVWYEESSTSYIVTSEEFIIRAQRIQNLSYALIQAGVKPGNRVAVIAPNSYVYLLLWLVKAPFAQTLFLSSPLIAG